MGGIPAKPPGYPVPAKGVIANVLNGGLRPTLGLEPARSRWRSVPVWLPGLQPRMPSRTCRGLRPATQTPPPTALRRRRRDLVGEVTTIRPQIARNPRRFWVPRFSAGAHGRSRSRSRVSTSGRIRCAEIGRGPGRPSHGRNRPRRGCRARHGSLAQPQTRFQVRPRSRHSPQLRLWRRVRPCPRRRWLPSQRWKPSVRIWRRLQLEFPVLPPRLLRLRWWPRLRLVR